MVRICAKRDFIYIVLFLAVTACVAFTRKDRFEGLRFNEPANYTRTVPGAGAGFEMVYIPGGEFDMGSPGTETGRLANEGPVHRVRVSPFWLCSTEVTWKLFEQYSIARDSTMLDAVTLASPKIQWQWIKRFSKWTEQRFYMWTHDLDAITRPSPYYGAYDHGMGRREKPAIGMSWLGAKTFCQWLTRKTGEKYRLPTEAEWEYAARAGSSSAYCFGDDPAGLDDYGWYEDNSDWETRKIGTSEPNAWGVYDMHGNVWEFCADAYDSLYYETLSKKKVAVDPFLKPRKGSKPVLRGGSWDDMPEDLRSARRLGQQDWWNERDPQRPRGLWWLVDAPMVGFRVARSFED